MKKLAASTNNPFGGDNWFYIDEENERIIEVYYNHDALSGGQIVEMYMPYSLIVEADRRCGDEKDFFRYLDENAHTELIDVDTDNFVDAIKYYESNEPTFKNINRDELARIAVDERTHREYTSHSPFIAESIIVDDTMSSKEQLQQRLENGIRSILDSEQFKNWLNTGSKLFYRNYSFQNALLIWAQKENASYVMSYEKWKEFGRNVVRGAEGAKIFVPLMAYEKSKGALFKSVKKNLMDLLSQNPSINEASYRLGTSRLEFTMNRANKIFGYKIDGRERQLFGSEDEMKRFIERTIIGKLPVGFTVGTVFDVSDVVIPEYLWMKRGYTKDELALDANGNIVKNKRGEVRIVNTPERQARFQTSLDMSIAAKDPAKMQVLFEACVAASERKGVPVSLASKDNDEVLNGGASGYYSREFSENNPNGYIIIDEALEPTEKCSVLFHEMGHADLHRNLQLLAEQMGEAKISKEMREVQAEAVAFATASAFGIETDTSSFKYLAIYSKGFELQDFKKSLEVIFKETTALVNDIKAELDMRGLKLDLTDKERALLEPETIKTLSTRYMDFYSRFYDTVQSSLSELPELVKGNIKDKELIELLRYQNELLNRQKSDLRQMFVEIEVLNNADTREKQDMSLKRIESAVERIQTAAHEYEELSRQFMSMKSNGERSLLDEFREDPFKALELMKSKYVQLTYLSNIQLKYLAGSRFVQDELIKLYYTNENLLVDKLLERADMIVKVASENGTFVEVNYCEQWTDTPFFEKGTLCSPKIANKIISGTEVQTLGMKNEAKSRGDYFPYTKCELALFTPHESDGLLVLNTKLDIGDGSQSSLEDHLNQICKTSKQVYVKDKFVASLNEPAYKDKIMVQRVLTQNQGGHPSDAAEQRNKQMPRDEWATQIKSKKEILNPNDSLDVFKEYLKQLESQEDDVQRELSDKEKTKLHE